MANMILGLFDNRTNAENAIEELKSLGYNPEDISIVMRDSSEAADMSNSTGANVVDGAVSGATTGGVIGGIAGLLVGIGAIAVPGVGGLLVGGPIAAALGLTGAAATAASGAVTGALAGGLIGGLTGLGVSEEDAAVYERRIKEGAILVALPARESATAEAEDILDDYGAEQVTTVNLNTA